MADIRFVCDGAGRKYGCGNPVAFVARRECDDTASEFVCGKHLSAALAKWDDTWIVMPVKRK